MKHLIFVLILIPTTLFCQRWEKTFGLGKGYSVQQTSDNGYIVTGTQNSKIYLFKTDEFGDILWTKTFCGQRFGEGFSVQQTTDGGYILSGNISVSPNNLNIYIIKTDENGDSLWTKEYGGNEHDEGFSVQQTLDSGYIITGYHTNDLDWPDVYLLKTDKLGDTLWTKTYGGQYEDKGYSVQQTSDNGYILTGCTRLSASEISLYLIKTNEIGDTLWTKKFSNGFGSSVKQTLDGGYIISGVKSGLTFDNVYLIKTNENGDTSWTRKYGSNIRNVGYSVQQTNDQGYIITGWRSSIDPHTSIFIIKTNEIGDTLWTKRYGGEHYDKSYSVGQTLDGGYIITGIKNESIYLIKTDEGGNIVSIPAIHNLDSDLKLIKLIDFSGKEISMPKENQPYIELYDDGTTKKKIIIK